MKDRKAELESYRQERRQMLELKDDGSTLEEISATFGGSTQAVSARIKLARKERAQERRAATIRAKQEQAHA
jgi:hypothetical protein